MKRFSWGFRLLSFLMAMGIIQGLTGSAYALKYYWNGFYEFKGIAWKSTGDDGKSRWATKDPFSGEENPQHFLENRFSFDIAPGVWSFLKLTAKGGGSSFDAQMQEGALRLGKYGKDSRDRGWGFEMLAFKNWAEYNIGHNIDLVSNDSGRWDFNKGGVRFNAWGKDFWGHLVTGPSADGQDQAVLRWGRNFFDAKLTLANFWGYKRWDSGDNFNRYFGFELRGNHQNFFSPASVFYQVNWATSQTSAVALSAVPGAGDDLLDIEIRDFQFFGPNLGTLGFNLRYQDYDLNFRDFISNSFSSAPDKKEYFGEIYYNFPANMITFVVSDRYNENQSGVKQFEDFNSRLEIEFINNFTAKMIYKSFKDTNGIFKNYIFWLRAADEKGFVRAGFRVRDPETIFKRRFFAVEGNYLITERFSLFARAVTAEQVLDQLNRKSIFAQLRYDWESTRLFLEYGPSWIGSNSLVEDDNVADPLNDSDWERKNQDRVQLLFQVDW